jgi:cyclophilin family peptidyl-prolyl cis-trans isomerase
MTATEVVVKETPTTLSAITFYSKVHASMLSSSRILKTVSGIVLSATVMLAAASPAAAQSVAPPAVPAAAPADAVDPENILHLDLSTGGRVTIRMYPDKAPAHVERIKTLTRKGFYNNLVFHRVIDGFMAQTGDPTGTGSGDSELPDLKAEFNPTPHLRGTVSMARTNEPDTANSQFFICFQPRFALDNKYTVFGRVTAGMQFVDAIERGEPPANPSRILQASIAADNVPPPVALTAAPAPSFEQPKVSVEGPDKPQGN